MGQDTWRRWYVDRDCMHSVQEETRRLMRRCSIQGSHHPRRPQRTISPLAPQITHRSRHPLLTRLSARVVLSPPPCDSPGVLPLLLCVLARGVRRRARMGAHAAEQASLGREGGAEERLVRW
jgi:hypothetical protein